MNNIIKTIILDFQEVNLETGLPRHINIMPVHNKATVCIGVRRSGKSTYMFQRMKQLIDAGIARENILYLNFFDDRLHFLQHAGLAIILETYFSIYPEKKNEEKVYCFFDEIQVVSKWEPFVDRLMRTENCEVYITGSSAQMLSKEIATQMRGRALSWEMFPFSFQEFLDYKNVNYKKELSTKKRLLIQKAFDEYCRQGGFPEVIHVDSQLRIKIHQEYFNAMMFRDLVERHNIAHPKAVLDLAHWLIDNIASLYSINNLTGYLKSLGHKVPKSVVSDYIAWFEDAYILFTVRIFGASVSRANTNPKKIYCIDHAFVVSVSSGILLNKGHLLENLVFIALRRLTSNIFYYKTKSGREVNFIIQQKDRSHKLIQVCETIKDPKTYKREVESLSEAMSELNTAEGFIVTYSEEELILFNNNKINVIPAWRFMLEELAK